MDNSQTNHHNNTFNHTAKVEMTSHGPAFIKTEHVEHTTNFDPQYDPGGKHITGEQAKELHKHMEEQVFTWIAESEKKKKSQTKSKINPYSKFTNAFNVKFDVKVYAKNKQKLGAYHFLAASRYEEAILFIFQYKHIANLSDKVKNTPFGLKKLYGRIHQLAKEIGVNAHDIASEVLNLPKTPSSLKGIKIDELQKLKGHLERRAQKKAAEG